MPPRGARGRAREVGVGVLRRWARGEEQDPECLREVLGATRKRTLAASIDGGVGGPKEEPECLREVLGAREVGVGVLGRWAIGRETGP